MTLHEAVQENMADEANANNDNDGDNVHEENVGEDGQENADGDNDGHAEESTDPLGQVIMTTWDDFRTMPLSVVGVVFMLGMMFQAYTHVVNWVVVALCAASFLGGAACGMLATSQFEPVGVLVNYASKSFGWPRAIWYMPMARFETASTVLMSASNIGSGVNAGVDAITSIASGVEAMANAMS